MRKIIKEELENWKNGRRTYQAFWWIEQLGGKMTPTKKEELKAVLSTSDKEQRQFYNLKMALVNEIPLTEDLASVAVEHTIYFYLIDKILDKYIHKYPSLIFTCLKKYSDDNEVIRALRSNVMFHSMEFTTSYLNKVLDLMESENLNQESKELLLELILFSMMKETNKYSKEFLSRLTTIIAKNTHEYKIVDKLIGYLNDDLTLVNQALEQFVQSNTFNRILKKNPNSIKSLVRLIQKYVIQMTPTQLTNFFSLIMDIPDLQYEILRSIPEQPKYLKLFMYLSRTKDQKLKELVKQKIDRFKS